MQTLLLKKSIQSKYFNNSFANVALNDDCLTGSLIIQAGDRTDLVSNMFDKHIDPTLYALSETTTVTFSSNLNSTGNNTDEVSQSAKVNIGYDFYKEKLDLGDKKINCIIEEVRAYAVTTSDGKTSGVYGFELELTHHRGYVTLYINLDHIYVEPEFSDSIAWMDLTIAVYSFTNEVISVLSKILPKPYYFDIYVCADFLNKSDEKIANIILREVQAEFESLPVIMRNQPAFIGGVVADMGY